MTRSTLAPHDASLAGTPPLGALYFGPHGPAAVLGVARSTGPLAPRQISRLQDADSGAPGVLLLDRTVAQATPALASALSALPPMLVVVAVDEGLPDDLPEHPGIFLRISATDPESRILATVKAALQHAVTRAAAGRAEEELARTRNELDELSRIGALLMTERDPDRLLHQILEQARRLTSSDAGSLYLLEEGEEPRLRFKLAQNDSLHLPPFTEHSLPLDPSSLAGYVAATGTPVVLADAYQTEGAPFKLNRDFDRTYGYRTRSMLVVPMTSQRGQRVGVLQIINRKTDPLARITDDAAADQHVVPFNAAEQRLVEALAGQASAAIETTRLYSQIEQLFDSFVRASVTAIEQRDPTTAGHSNRVAEMSCGLAEALMRRGRGTDDGWRISTAQMRELRYAALLHDFGKIGVREEVLVKAKKLPPLLADRVQARFRTIRLSLEREYHRARAEHLQRHGRESFRSVGPLLDREFAERLAELDRIQAAIQQANEPTILAEAVAGELETLARRTFPGPHGEPEPFLTEDELRFLTIPRGTLDDAERREIESHVEQTYRFLLQIPWTDDLRGVADIAYGHHEKLNGTGYPRGAREDQISVQTRIITVTDIFDALTASDRPYKKALGYERALDIVRGEARAGMLDGSIVDAFVESEVWRSVL